MSGFKWIKFSEMMPDKDRDIYVTDYDEVRICSREELRNYSGIFTSWYAWCYVYIPDVPNKKGMTVAERLIEHEERIESLETKIRLLQRNISELQEFRGCYEP